VTCAAMLVLSGGRFSFAMPITAMRERMCGFRGRHLTRNADAVWSNACWWVLPESDVSRTSSPLRRFSMPALPFSAQWIR
jgi:hypothetical protein